MLTILDFFHYEVTLALTIPLLHVTSLFRSGPVISWLRVIYSVSMILLKVPTKAIPLLCFIPFVLGGTISVEVDKAIELLEKRIEIKKDTAKLRSDWEVDQAELKQEETLLDAELTGLEDKLEVLLEINNDLLAREDTATGSAEDQDRILERLKKSAGNYEALLLQLTPRLPAPLSAQVKDELGEGVDREAKNIGARYQSLVSALNLVHRFNQKPFFTKESYEAKQLDTMYWGIALGYRIDPSNTIAQVGWPGDDAWIWENANEHLDRIRQAFSVHEGLEIPSFIQLPLRSSHE